MECTIWEDIHLIVIEHMLPLFVNDYSGISIAVPLGYESAEIAIL